MVFTALPSSLSAVGRVLDVVAGEAAQNRLCVRRTFFERGGVLHHFIVLLFDQRPVDRASRGRFQVGYWRSIDMSVQCRNTP